MAVGSRGLNRPELSMVPRFYTAELKAALGKDLI